MEFYPEGYRLGTDQNRLRTASLSALAEAAKSQDILEGKAMVCDAAHNLIVDLGGGLRGIIPREEGALGVREGKTRDIAMISRVNKPVCFTVTGFETRDGEVLPVLSRRAAQERCLCESLSHLTPGDVIDAQITHLEPFGAFADIGCGVSSLLPIDAISVSRISHPRDRFTVGQRIRAVVRGRDAMGRISLTHKELLGSWLENAALFSPGETVAGIVRSVEPYGIFIELTPNLAGLAEPKGLAQCGQTASVYIKSLIPSRMKVKLILIECFAAAPAPAPFIYRETARHISRWRYSPPGCDRIIETVFDSPEEAD
ncbi:MAG: RNA-binding protein [Oscillospiraceae bacterium]|nr:MAG: RNA-binding protein [Oscillospiraceae bacterium]